MSRLLLLGTAFLAALLSPFSAPGAIPTILSVQPAPGSTVSALSQIAVTFSTPVVGAEAADLQINDTPATLRSVSNAVVTFQFSPPQPGLVVVNFDADAVITDPTGGLFDPLAANAAWTYTLADIVAPVVAATEPPAGSIASGLDRIEVQFNEAVTGVDASDLLINGVPAAGVTAAAPDRYLFTFPAAGSGAVTISWAAGHGIRDVSPAANSFVGAGWSYTVDPAAPATVVINEFLAENLNSLEDADGEKQD